MKKAQSIPLILIFIMSLFLGSCGNKSNETKNSSTQDSVFPKTTNQDISGVNTTIETDQGQENKDTGIGSEISQNDMDTLKSWIGSYNIETGYGYLEVSKADQMGIKFRFEGDETIEGEAAFEKSDSEQFGKAVSDKGFKFEMNRSDNSIKVEDIDKFNGIWQKQSTIFKEDLSTNGVQLGMKYDEAAKILDLDEKLVFDDETESEDIPVFTSIEKDGLYLEFQETSDHKGTIVEIIVKDPKYSTYRGIKIGDTYEKVVDEYGKPDGDDKVIFYSVNPYNLSFKMKDNQVQEIDMHTDS